MSDTCPDCAVAPGQPHVPGCDVARCKCCGWQDIGWHNTQLRGGVECPEDRPSTIWTGRWPGDVEAEEYGLDLNELAVLCAKGVLRWDVDKERWTKDG